MNCILFWSASTFLTLVFGVWSPTGSATAQQAVFFVSESSETQADNFKTSEEVDKAKPLKSVKMAVKSRAN